MTRKPDEPPPEVLHGERLVLRRATDADIPALLRVLASAEVAEWWGDVDEAALREEVCGDEVATFAVEVDGAIAGMIQYHEENEPGYRHAGIDVALAGPWQHRGLGVEAVRTLARHLFEQRGHHRITIDPAADNRRAIDCYQRAGFRPVGVMRSYERGRDGTWHDGLLMDMLRDELR